MRYFLYTYAFLENFQITRRLRVFGAPMGGGDHLDSKVQRLKVGDIIVIRDGSNEALSFLGYCAVAGPLIDTTQHPESPWPGPLWRDELELNRVIYQWRCAVDFEFLPQLNLYGLNWEDLDSLGFINSRARPILGAQAWSQKLSGNFVEGEQEVNAFHALVKFEPYEES